MRRPPIDHQSGKHFLASGIPRHTHPALALRDAAPVALAASYCAAAPAATAIFCLCRGWLDTWRPHLRKRGARACHQSIHVLRVSVSRCTNSEAVHSDELRCFRCTQPTLAGVHFTPKELATLVTHINLVPARHQKHDSWASPGDLQGAPLKAKRPHQLRA